MKLKQEIFQVKPIFGGKNRRKLDFLYDSIVLFSTRQKLGQEYTGRYKYICLVFEQL